MEFQDRILQCVDWRRGVRLDGGEQQFFADKNFKNEPKRCKACKGKRASRPAGAVARERVETATNCSACGKETTVPFKPTQGRRYSARNASSPGNSPGPGASSRLLRYRISPGFRRRGRDAKTVCYFRCWIDMSQT